jgi:hypothetical protein
MGENSNGPFLRVFRTPKKFPYEPKSRDTSILNWARSPLTTLFGMTRLARCSSIISLPTAIIPAKNYPGVGELALHDLLGACSH